jgi:hypothetical protein
MSNSSRIEAATRQHVGAVFTSEQVTELVRLSNPEWKGGIYPSGSAYTRTPEGLKPRGKTAYGDGILEYLGSSSFKVLSNEEIVRRPGSGKTQAAAPAPVPAAPVAATEKKGKKKASKVA